MLNAEQKAAVETESSRALVLAGAGSGKTRVLIERIVYLIEEKHVAPSEILAFTFTRQAANEMRERLQERIGPKANGVYLSTMHGIALSMLQRFPEYVGLRQNFTVYSDFEFDVLLRDVAADLGILRKGKTWKPAKKTIMAMFNRFDQTGEAPGADTDTILHDLFTTFHRRCLENNSVTYSGLIHGLDRLVDEGIINQFTHWRHVLVDEAQDIDTLQWSIVETLTESRALFAVADPSQAIYSFRGAIPEHIIDHEGTFDVFRLENNYRCHPEIVDAANRLIEHNQKRLRLTMQAMVEDTGGQAVKYKSGMDSELLAGFIKENSANNGGCAVLARNHILLQTLEAQLQEQGVPCVRVGKQSEITRTEAFRRMIAPLKLMRNPRDNFSFLLCKDVLLGERSFAEVRTEAARQGVAHYEAAPETPAVDTFRAFSDTDCMGDVWPEVVDMFIQYGQACDETAEFVQKRVDRNPFATVGAFLDWLALYEVQDEKNALESESGVQLMTIHAAKGLEFDDVVLAGWNEGILPSKQAGKTEDGIEEERRLAYVALTRAKKQLYITSRPTRTEKEYEGGRKVVYENPVSRFVEEVVR
jgi:DNA helicase-2/ATP-dependent DNA helicase PcrA